MDYETEELCCMSCSTVLMEPYIRCVECSSTAEGDQVFLCLHCFAKGVEFTGHQSDHPYTVIKNNFHLFERHWTAVEERQLLKAVADSGYGNWSDVAHQLGSKTHTECERHYNSCYIDNPSQGLPEFTDPVQEIFPCPVIYKLSEDPPRPSDHSLVHNEMAGYMAGRGDFTTEYDNFMELDLRHMEFDREELDPLETELNLAVLEVYQRCLRERQRRKRLIRKHGLINVRKFPYLQRRFEITIKHLLDDLRIFTQLVSPQEYDMYLESLHYECELKSDILHLQECYKHRVKRLRNINIFKRLKGCREKEKQNRHLLSDVLHNLKDETACQTWLQRQATMDSLGKGVALALPNAPRRSAPPLDVSGLPGYDKITDRERELCAHIRLVPEAYIEFKRTLVSECIRVGCLKLAQARSLIKIDVISQYCLFQLCAHIRLVPEAYIEFKRTLVSECIRMGCLKLAQARSLIKIDVISQYCLFQLCAHIRLVPEAYVEFKRTLVSECIRVGCLKLAQARSLIKIDVNKTRKIYDFLVQEGLVNKDIK